MFNYKELKSLYHEIIEFIPLRLVANHPEYCKRLPATLCNQENKGVWDMFEIRINPNIPNPRVPLSTDAIIGDPGELTMFTFITTLGDHLKIVDSASERIKYFQSQISKLQSELDLLVNSDEQVQCARKLLDDAKKNHFNFLLSTAKSPFAPYTAPSESSSEFNISQLEKDFTRERISTKERIENAAIDPDKNLCGIIFKQAKRERLNEISKFMVNGLMMNGLSYRQCMESYRGKIKSLVDRLHHSIKRLVIHFQNIICPRYIAKGKMSCYRFGELWDSLGRLVSIRGGMMVHAEESFSTSNCLCGNYCPPGRKRYFHCTNRECNFHDARDCKAPTMILCSIHAKSTKQLPKSSSSLKRKRPTDTTTSSSSNKKASNSKVSLIKSNMATDLRH